MREKASEPRLHRRYLRNGSGIREAFQLLNCDRLWRSEKADHSSACFLDVNFNRQSVTRGAKTTGLTTSHELQTTEAISRKGFPGNGQVVRTSAAISLGSCNPASVPVHNVIRQQCLLKIAYTGYVNTLHRGRVSVMGIAIATDSSLHWLKV